MEANQVVMSGIQLKKLLSKKSEPIMNEYDLRPVELDILVFLHEEKNMDTAKEIIQYKHLSKAHVSKSLDNLKSRGFIEITEDEADHRISRISLIGKSQEVIDKVTKVHKECCGIIQKGISADEMKILKSVIEKMSENINRELGE